VNRVHYLVGSLIGVVAVGVVATGLRLASGSLEPYVDPHLLPLIFIFAGTGSVTSVLTRLSSIDLRQEPSRFLVCSRTARGPSWRGSQRS
jgi:formate-dependent nitrite reductase membrane component NrfD